MSDTESKDSTGDRLAQVGLSPRQRDCLEMAGDGHTSKEIARTLELSPKTVDHHIAAAIKTLGAHNRVEAALRLEELKRAPAEPSGSPRTHEGAEGDEAPLPPTNSEDPARRKKVSRIAVAPPIGGVANTVSRKERWFWMIRIGVLAIMASSVITLTILGLVELFGRLN